MKKNQILRVLFFILISSAFNYSVFCQGQTKNNKKNENGQKTIVKKMTYSGLQLPLLTDKQRDSIVNKLPGVAIFNTTANRPQYFDGRTWQNFTNERYIGENFGGGIVFYIDKTGQHGLIAAPTDLGCDISWGHFENAVEAYDKEVGIGEYNTKKIISFSQQQEIAAMMCFNLELNGYNDWFLPSKDELTLLYNNLKVKGLSKFVEQVYWSSSETDFGNAWVYDFENGMESERAISKGACVRAVRAF